ncbi:cell cycle and apoptosis regulator protein 2 [Sceloporus undulatus]|uniref:cell cycle and apoptosis regulator protein 2 n=1 Tax=Sceloporus undulatus TaxID=8520 RepID=UPI001C4D1DF4|nr:cell cycle and apoptosis regulator protein 2 [Sceloporus undulatus]XP_042327714.1 cell cycle and apoptosis regulator protein 2 [Sceloporus undulatus]XP_042327715.1 cell cycle and apoptosis regulator protein 2 [Sceloporus undulatus]
MAQFKRQKQLRASNLQGARSFSGTQPASLLGPAPGLLNPPISADIIQAARHLQGGEKQRVFTGIVTSLHDYFGVVDDEVFFQLSIVKGRIPQIGEKVLVKAVYNPNQSVPWNALKVQTLSNQPLLKPPTPLLHVASLGQKQGILGAQPQLLFQPHRIPPLFPQKPMSLFQTSPSLHLGHLGRYAGRGPKGRQDTGRWDDFDSKKRKQKGNEPWGVKKPRHEPPQYRVQLACYSLNSPFCDAMEILRRYCSIQLPKEFYDVRLSWLDTFPLTQPLTLRHPSRIQLASPAEEAPQADESPTQDSQPEDTNSAFSAKVLLLSSPGIEEFYRNCLLYIDDPSDQRESPEHPAKQIKFLLGKKADEAVLIGGEWSPSLDGPDPATNPMVLIRTAIRCTKAQIGLDLTGCTKWFRFAEFRYLCEGNPSHQEKTVVFLPDIWSCMPSLEEWEALYKQKAQKAPPPPLPPEETTTMDDETEQSSEPGPEQEMETSEQEVDTAEPASEPGVETSTAEPEAPAPPLEPAIVAYPPPALPGGQPSCTNLSLYTLLEYRRQREKLSFEVAVVTEFFQEMLQRDFGYKLYKALLALPEKEEPLEAKNTEAEKATESEKEAESELRDEPLEKPEAEEATESNQKESQKEEAGDAEKKPAGQDGSNSAKEEKVSENVKSEPKDSTDDLCDLSLEDDLLLLRDEEEEDFGVKLEDAEVRSVASNQSEMEFSSLHDVSRGLDPSAVLPLDALLAFIYFDLNCCGYLHRKDMEKLLLTLGLHLCKEQVKRLVNRVVTQFVCRYRNLHYSRQEGTEPGPEEEPLGNLTLLPSSSSASKVPAKSVTESQSGNLVLYNGAVLNVGKLLEKAEQTESSRLYLENKIHTLELKLEETQLRFSATETSNKSLTLEVQELQKRLAEMEEQSKVNERQKNNFQRLLQENKKRLTPLQLEIQKIIEKTNNCLEKKDPAPTAVSSN